MIDCIIMRLILTLKNNESNKDGFIQYYWKVHALYISYIILYG